MASKIKVDTLETANGSGSITLNNPIAGFTSTGIDDNATSTAITIDSSENVGIGTASPNRQLNVENTLANSGGVIGLTSSDSSTTGSLGIIHFGNSTDTSLASINGIADGSTSAGALLFKTEAAGGAIDERMRIDSAGHAIIGGGVTLGNGQTYAAANTLDDYEEGTWTIALTPLGGSIALSDAAGTYTKVGRQVTVCARANVSSVSSPSSLLTITGLPFTPINSASAYSSFAVQGSGWNFSGVQSIVGAVAGTVYVFGWTNGNQTGIASYMQAGAGMTVSFTYFTDS